MEFSDFVKKALAAKNLKPIDLARMTGYTPTFCYELLKGRKHWNQRNMERVCQALKIKIAYILEDDENTPSRSETRAG